MKQSTFLVLVIFILVGCSAKANFEYSMKIVPKNIPGEASPIVMEVKENGKAKTGLDIVGLLEMRRMDHGTIQVNFTDNGDGIYASNVQLPMGGEWIMELEVKHNGEKTKELLTLDVKEG